MSKRALTITGHSLSLAVVAIATMLHTLPGQAAAAETLSTVCKIQNTNDVKAQCKPGDIVLYYPETPTLNAQASAYVAALLCDFNKPIVWTNTTIACTYTGAPRRFRQQQ